MKRQRQRVARRIFGFFCCVCDDERESMICVVFCCLYLFERERRHGKGNGQCRQAWVFIYVSKGRGTLPGGGAARVWHSGLVVD